MKGFLIKQAQTYQILTSSLLHWTLISLVIGLVGGLIGTGFHLAIHHATLIRQAHPWLLWLLPLGGVVIVILYHSTHTRGLSTNDIISSILKGSQVPLLLTPVIFIASTITHLFGGSAGREGAALQIGGSLGYNTGCLFKLDEKQKRIAVLAGMAAVFSALFGTPITAVVFALEVASVGIFHYAGLVPCGIASLTAFAITQAFHIPPTYYQIPSLPFEAGLLAKVCLLAIACALLSSIFCRIMHWTGHWAKKTFPNDYLRLIVGGVAIIALTYLVGTRDYNGSGVEIIDQAILQGQAKPWAWALKILFTAITLGFSYKGGEIVPTFFIGSTFGCLLAGLLGIPTGFGAAIGLAATFCGAVNCPMATIFLTIEIFGAQNLLYFAPAIFLAYMLSGYTSLYHEQKILYSKINAEFIDLKVGA